jgi:hypothetical protein
MTKPITPPPELVRQWSIEAENEHQPTVAYSLVGQLATKAARWGADMELEACCIELTEKIITNSFYEGDKTHSSWRELASIVVRKLRAERRPKPPSLNSIALQMLGTIERDAHYIPEITDTIRRALEALDD